MEEISKAGALWTKEEHDDLLHEIAEGRTIQEIATIHKRTEGSITSRVKNIACELMKDENAIINDVWLKVGKLIDIKCIKAPVAKETKPKIENMSLESLLLSYAELQEEIAAKKLQAAKVQVKIRKIMYEKTTTVAKKT
jgi:hypothetical protein